MTTPDDATYSSLSIRSIALRVLPALVALGLLVIGSLEEQASLACGGSGESTPTQGAGS